jgi:hypothetical protein
MSRRRITSSCLLVASLAVIAGLAGCRTAAETGKLAGTVQDERTGDPIEGAEVTVGAATALTAARGQFTMEELEVGDRPATVTAPGYHTLTKTIPIKAGENTVVLELRRLGDIDGGAMDGPATDAPSQRDGGQRDAAQSDAPQSDAGVCTGTYCSAGYANGGCCASAQYCVNYYGASSLVCRATCGSTNERCAYNTDCCQGNCVSGYCAAPTCAGTTCSYGYYYGGCCADAQYCVNYYGASSTVCRATCGSTNERCAYASDCCSGLTCSSGYCVAASCEGTACTYGYIDYGYCCSTAQYCTNYSGSSYSVCRSTCGGTNERCYSNGDCCPSTHYCSGGYCVQACGAAGTSCTASYWNGGCCSSAPYCVNYYSQPTYCRATCGAASEHCWTTNDCCSPLQCVYNSSAGWNICTQL